MSEEALPQPVCVPPLKTVLFAGVYCTSLCFGSSWAQKDWIALTSATSAQSWSWFAFVPAVHWVRDVPAADGLDAVPSPPPPPPSWLCSTRMMISTITPPTPPPPRRPGPPPPTGKPPPPKPPPPRPRRFSTWLLSRRALGL